MVDAAAVSAWLDLGLAGSLAEEPKSREGLLLEPRSGGVTYAYVNDTTKKGSPHVHTKITD